MDLMHATSGIITVKHGASDKESAVRRHKDLQLTMGLTQRKARLVQAPRSRATKKYRKKAITTAKHRIQFYRSASKCF